MTKRPCLDCSRPVTVPRCSPCKARHRPPGYTTTARTVLARDGWRCQLGYPGCKGVATDAAHIDPRQPGVAANLRAACHPCNSRDG